jgi:hypothetical protein
MTIKPYDGCFVFPIAYTDFSYNKTYSDITQMKIMSEEIIKQNKISYNILHIYLYFDVYKDESIVREICKFLQINDLLPIVHTNKIELISNNIFDKDLEIGDGRGGHPIFEWWNTLCDWHIIQYKGNLFCIKTSDKFIIYKIKIGN